MEFLYDQLRKAKQERDMLSEQNDILTSQLNDAQTALKDVSHENIFSTVVFLIHFPLRLRYAEAWKRNLFVEESNMRKRQMIVV